MQKIIAVYLMAFGLSFLNNALSQQFQCPNFIDTIKKIKSTNDTLAFDGLTWYCLPYHCNLNNVTIESNWSSMRSFYRPESYELIIECSNMDKTYAITANAGTDYEKCRINQQVLTPNKPADCQLSNNHSCSLIECEIKHI